ncbi:chemotaxis protein CheW [Pseudomonas chlororaphis]|nr:chemotaxis protein CheW [Pseudomonas chlororaphis]
MNRPLDTKSRPQLALQSYLDSLLHEATEEDWSPAPAPAPATVTEPSPVLDEFQLAVLEEQARDAAAAAPRPSPAPQARAQVQAQTQPQAPVDFAPPPEAPAPLLPSLLPVAPLPEVLAEPLAPPAPVRPVPQALIEPVVEVHLPPSSPPPVVPGNDRPSWAAEPFECLLFDVAGLTLAVPLVCLGSIYSLAGHELTPLFGQPEWFLGILPSQAGNLKVLDTARWVMPDRYRDDFRQGLQYVISVQGYEWGLAVHQVSRSLRLDPNEIKWRSHRGQRPWLAGTVIEHMCALLDVSELAELIASGGAKHMDISKPAPRPI